MSNNARMYWVVETPPMIIPHEKMVVLMNAQELAAARQEFGNQLIIREPESPDEILSYVGPDLDGRPREYQLQQALVSRHQDGMDIGGTLDLEEDSTQ